MLIRTYTKGSRDTIGSILSSPAKSCARAWAAGSLLSPAARWAEPALVSPLGPARAADLRRLPSPQPRTFAPACGAVRCGRGWSRLACVPSRGGCRPPTTSCRQRRRPASPARFGRRARRAWCARSAGHRRPARRPAGRTAARGLGRARASRRGLRHTRWQRPRLSSLEAILGRQSERASGGEWWNGGSEVMARAAVR